MKNDELQKIIRDLVLLRKENSVLNNLDNTSKCDIIDIADKEMERLSDDIEEMDEKYKEALFAGTIEELINLINKGECTQKHINVCKRTINDKDILDIRVSEKNIYIKTTKGIIPLSLSVILKISEDFIERVPIEGKYNFYLINAEKCAPKEVAKAESDYKPEYLVEDLKALGRGELESQYASLHIDYLVRTALYELKDIYVRSDIEDKVVAIGIGQYIPNAKKYVSTFLGINPELFIEVSGVNGTVILIDTRKCYLEELHGDLKWYL